MEENNDQDQARQVRRKARGQSPGETLAQAGTQEKQSSPGREAGELKKEGPAGGRPYSSHLMSCHLSSAEHKMLDQDQSYTQKPPERKQKVLHALVKIVDGEIQVFPIADTDEEYNEIMLTLWPEGWQQ